MAQESRLNGKRILIVDDESDVLDTLESLLPMCNVVKALSFEQAKRLLEEEVFDIVILDIMGVDGYALLRVANERNFAAVMLTAHALSVKDTVKSYKMGAASYLPKEKLDDIQIFLVDVLEAKEKGESSWWRWLERLESYYNERFGPNWREGEKEFWEKVKYRI